MNEKSKVLVLGAGISGRAAAAFLLSRGHSVIAVDQKANELREKSELQHLFDEGLEIVSDYSFTADEISQVILSPGVPPTHPLVRSAKEKKIEVIGEVELAFRYMSNRCIGITGSNGKTTTVLLTAHVLNKAGIKARALGNVGIGLSSYLLDPDPQEILVVELSSFQLETLQAKRLDIAAILNITPNHLDRHSSMQEYAAAKISIQNCLKEAGKMIISKKVADQYGAFFRKYEIYDEEENIALTSNFEYIKMGAPEWMNCKAAFSIVKEFGIAKEKFDEALKEFRKPPHRIEWVAEIDKVVYYNDSKSSNIDSVMHAVRLLEGPIILIVGGTDKGSSYFPWIDCFQGKVKRIIAYGLAASKIEAEIGSVFPFNKVGPFEEAVRYAKEAAVENDTVLLSPGCSSYDQFRSFEHRGDEFKKIVKEMRQKWIEKKQS